LGSGDDAGGAEAKTTGAEIRARTGPMFEYDKSG
jgi:hypothetical protein